MLFLDEPFGQEEDDSFDAEEAARRAIREASKESLLKGVLPEKLAAELERQRKLSLKELKESKFRVREQDDETAPDPFK